MNIQIQTIQINQQNIYKFSIFPEERIKTLISELNVHYEKINNYIEAKVSGDNINTEVIDCLAKLKEINRLASPKLHNNHNSADFILCTQILDSIIALLETDAGHASTKKNLLKLGHNLLNKLYEYSFSTLIYSALLYNWLKKRNLIANHSINNHPRRYKKSKPDRLIFDPSDDDLNKFFEENQQQIFEYMTFEMGPNKEEFDPFSNSQAADFYHYHQTLINFETQQQNSVNESIE